MTMAAGNTTHRKRFYKEVEVVPAAAADGFRVLLDGRVVRTPAKRELVLPVSRLAEIVAAEWRRQGDKIDPLTMPMMRLANSAIDGVAGRENEVRMGIIAYGQSDLLCYLAEGPQELVERQSSEWGAVHAWAKKAFGIELELAVGIMPVEQPADQLAILDRALGTHGPLALAAIHVATTLTGSLLLVLAMLHGRIDAAHAWRLAHIDEDFQFEKWGADAEATARREKHWRDMETAAIALSQLNVD